MKARQSSDRSCADGWCRAQTATTKGLTSLTRSKHVPEGERGSTSLIKPGSWERNIAAGRDSLGRADVFWRRTDDAHLACAFGTPRSVDRFSNRNRYELGNSNWGTSCGARGAVKGKGVRVSTWRNKNRGANVVSFCDSLRGRFFKGLCRLCLASLTSMHQQPTSFRSPACCCSVVR